MHDFPRDPTSSFNHIKADAVRDAVIALAEGVFDRPGDAHSNDFQTMLDGEGGWNVIEVLKIGAASAFLKGLDESDYNAALVKQALADRGWAPQVSSVPTI